MDTRRIYLPNINAFSKTEPVLENIWKYKITIDRVSLLVSDV